MPRRWRRITPETRREIIKLAARGMSGREIARKVDVPDVGFVLKPLGGVTRAEMWSVSEKRLSADERVEIRIGLERNLSLRVIARGIGRHPATVCREVNGNGGRGDYQPLKAHRLAAQRARRPKLTKLATNPVLCERVVNDLKGLGSPEQISERLRKEFGDDQTMRVSHETIYKSLYVQGRGGVKREFSACLRTGRAKRIPRGGLQRKGRIPNMVMISERPPEAADRAVPGHWEGDLLIGKQGKSAIGTLVERSTRFVLLFSLQEKTAEEVRRAMAKVIKTLPSSLRRTLTWDQGREMAEHAQFQIDTGVQVYFCDPHSPWQRGSNENTNGLLRQYFPKGMDLSKLSTADLKRAQDGLNGRPRKTLGWMKAAEKFNELVASID